MSNFFSKVKIGKDKDGNFVINKKGITLIALVITIVVLIILATLAIGISLGQNGIFNRAKQAKEDYLVKANEEQVELAKAGTLQSSRDTVESSVPIGTIIAYYKSTAPEGYVACDGTAYDLSLDENKKYIEIAKFLTDEENPTSFVAPDLRGEFLRGAGTNSRSGQGSGSAVGTHQNATQHVSTYNDPNNNNIVFDATNSSSYSSASNFDTNISGNFNTRGAKYLSFNIDGNNKGMSKMFTSRPTNTSVLYCIKY